jgi:hypothetical protein
VSGFNLAILGWLGQLTAGRFLAWQLPGKKYLQLIDKALQ